MVPTCARGNANSHFSRISDIFLISSSSGSGPTRQYKMVTQRVAKPSIVRTWLQFLAIPAYASNFEENGYEDLETIKLICEEDLLEIGIEDAHHRQIILASVKILKEQGAAWVYLLLASQEQQLEKKDELEEEEEAQEDDGESTLFFPLSLVIRNAYFSIRSLQRFIIHISHFGAVQKSRPNMISWKGKLKKRRRGRGSQLEIGEEREGGEGGGIGRLSRIYLTAG